MNTYVYSDEARKTLESVQQPLTVYQLTDGQIVTLLVSDGFCRLLGYATREQAVWDMDHDMYKDTHPDDRERIAAAAMRFATGGDQDECDVVFRTRAGVDSDYRVIHAHGKHVFTETGIRLAHVWYMDEGLYIEGDEAAGTQMNRELNSALHEESILRANRYDALTGLPNLAYFFEQCEAQKAKAYKQGKQGCLLYMDLNGMKYYNHRHGFAAGNQLLKTYADLIAKIFGRERSCHIAADRFAAATSEDVVEEKIRQLFSGVDQIQNHLSVCVGVYCTSLEDIPISSAYDRAKIACDTVRRRGKNDYCFFTAELSESHRRRSYIQENFDKAVAERWIEVYYQAIVRAVNEKICSEEALARWNDPELGFLSPGEFIPVLETSGQIYKLDLYVLERVLEKINQERDKGISIVPHSVNLSRSDFEACDMVEEIRKRVDAAGVERKLIAIEITESVIGSHIDFMRSQVERFQQLGFPVWMDDFGSGYSSLNVLQSIRFDLIKFDMSFMRKLDEGNARIVLTDLMKLATSLGVDTVCEGVETEEQVHFLQEIGCSKLQGFRYSQPISFQKILERYTSGMLVGFEDPAASSYFETIGRINVYDLDVIATREEDSMQHSFKSIPVGIIEVREDMARFVRCNPSYQEFMKRAFGIDVSTSPQQYRKYGSQFMNNVVKKCRLSGSCTVFDEKMPDGSIVHSFARRLSVNPKTGDIAIAVAVLSISKPNDNLLIERLLSMIEQFGEHIPGGFLIYRADESEELLYANKAVCDIFGCENLQDFKAFTGFTFGGMVHPEDHRKASDAKRENASLRRPGRDSVEYRIIRKDGATRWIDDYSHYMEADAYHGLYYVFITDITSKFQQAQSDKAKRAAVIEALTKAYDSVWLINDVHTQQFELYRIDQEMEHLMPANVAKKIGRFSEAFTFYSRLVLEEDRQRFLDAVSPGSIVKNTTDKPIYSVPFRRVFDNGVRNYRVEFARLALPGGKMGIVGGFRNTDEEVRKDQQIQDSLNESAAVIEALTRVYDSVWLIKDLETQRFELYRVDQKLVHLMPAHAAAKIEKYHDAFTFYSKLVLDEDRQRFLDAVSPQSILENTKNQTIYSVPFRRVFEDGIRYYRVEFARLNLNNGEINMVVGFKDVDGDMRKNKM